MEILQGVHYFYTTNGQQVGPVDGNEMVRLAHQGYLSETDQVWTEGMAEWLPVTAFSQLAAGIHAATDVAYNNPVMDDGSVVVKEPALARPGVIMVPREETVPERYRKRVSFGAWIWTAVMPLLILGVTSFGSAWGPRLGYSSVDDLETIVVILFGLALLFLVINSIIGLVILHRAWSHIQEIGLARTTPGKAVGFLFIPFFNLYWVFIAYYGWAEDYNRYIEEMGADHIVPANSGFQLAAIICNFVQLPFLWPFAVYMMCRCTNDIADLPAPGDLGIDPASIPGSRFGYQA